MSFQTALSLPMLQKIPFQIINIHSISGQNQSKFDVILHVAIQEVAWILKNSKDLLEYIHCVQSRSLSSCNSIKTFDFSTLYTTIPHSKLKDILKELVQLHFINKMAMVIQIHCLREEQILFCKRPLWFY